MCGLGAGDVGRRWGDDGLPLVEIPRVDVRPDHDRAGRTRHDGPGDDGYDPDGADADEPPLPGKISYHQAKEFATSWLRGQPNRAAIATTLFKDRIQQLKG